MPKGKKNYTTLHVCIPINNPRRNIPSEHDQNARYRLQQSDLDSFHAEVYGSVFLSVGTEAKLDMYINFDLDKLFDLHFDPPSSEDPPLCRIIQEGKDPILTTDFYQTNVKPRSWILSTPPQNKDTSDPSGAAAADMFTPVIEPDQVQPGEIRLHSWMLYTSQAPVLDLREETITSNRYLRDAFHQLHLCPEEAEKYLEKCLNSRRKPRSPKSFTKELSDSDTSEEEQVHPKHKTSEEERHHGTIHGSALATQIALTTLGHKQTPPSKEDLIIRKELRNCQMIKLQIKLDYPNFKGGKTNKVICDMFT